jgi:flagellar motor switch protein FliN
MGEESGMPNPNQAIPPDVARRLAQSIERLLASLGGTASAGFREARETDSLRSAPGPLVALTFRFSRGSSGPGALVLPGAVGLGLTRLLLGETADAAPTTPGPEDEDALSELANQAASGVATALGECLGKPVGFEAPAAKWLPAGGAGLPVWSDRISLVVALSVGGMTADAFLVVPRAAIVPAPAAAPVEATLPPLRESAERKNGNGMELLLDISLPVTVELGRTRMMIRDILHLAPGSVLELDKLAGEPVDILVNDKSIARGEVVVIDESFGVRLTSIVTPSERVASLQ